MSILPCSCDFLIQADIIVTQNAKREIIENGAITVNGDTIVEIGNYFHLKEQFSAKQELYLGKTLLMPGLVNAHTHLAMTFLRGVANDLPLLDWLQNIIFPIEAELTKDIVRVGTKLAVAEMLISGTTTVCDMYLFEEEVLKIAADTGIRILGGSVLFGLDLENELGQDVLYSKTKNLMDLYANNSRVHIAMMPHSVYTTSPTSLSYCVDIAEQLNIPIHMHLAESKAETEVCLQKWGKRPVQVALEAGILTKRTNLAHCVDLNSEEISLLIKKGVTVTHNPESNLKLGSGFAPVSYMLANGLCVALGTDGVASNNNLNMFGEMNTCALLEKGIFNNPTLMSAETVLDMATINGAKSLFFNDIGRFEKGCKADIVGLDLCRPNMQPLYNPIAQLVYAASGCEVHFTMIDGKVLYKDRKFIELNYPEVLEEVKEIQSWVKTKLNNKVAN